MSYRDDPEWQAAQRDFIDPPGANADESLANRVLAICKMYEIERNTP